MKKILLINILFLSAICRGQSPGPQFNHCFLVLDSSDYLSLTGSAFIKNEFLGFFIKSNGTDKMSWTGAYLFGSDNYLEIFATSASAHRTGSSAIALGTDHTGEIAALQNQLSKDYKTGLELKQRKVNDALIPWFTALYIEDSALLAGFDIDFWIMEYRKEYFAYNHWDTASNSVSRKQYLAQHEEKRKGKYLQRFTGIVFRARPDELDFYSSLLLRCGFKKAGKNSFTSSEGFTIQFESRKPSDKYSIKSIRFATTKSSVQQVAISPNIMISLNDLEGEIMLR